MKWGFILLLLEPSLLLFSGEIFISFLHFLPSNEWADKAVFYLLEKIPKALHKFIKQ